MASTRRGRRDIILQVAEEAFATQGFNGVGMREIAAQAGIHSATLYHYFPGKEQLFFAVIGRTFQEAHEWIREALDGPLDARGKFAFFIEKQFDFLATHRNYLRIILHERLCESPRLKEIAARFVRPLVETLVSILDEIAREGAIRSVDCHQTLFQIMTLNAGHIIFSPMLSEVMMLGDPLDPQFLETLKRANIKLLLHGLAT